MQRGTNFWLSCQFQLDRDQQLYSVKWYKNNEEFYRLIQSSSQQQQQQLLAGNNILDSGSSPPSSSSPDHPSQAANQQQQYFSQSGVNVLVSLFECVSRLCSTVSSDQKLTRRHRSIRLGCRRGQTTGAAAALESVETHTQTLADELIKCYSRAPIKCIARERGFLRLRNINTKFVKHPIRARD